MDLNMKQRLICPNDSSEGKAVGYLRKLGTGGIEQMIY